MQTYVYTHAKIAKSIFYFKISEFNAKIGFILYHFWYPLRWSCKFQKKLNWNRYSKKSELILDIFNTRLEGILELVGKARAEPYGSYGSGAIGRIKLEIIGLSDLRNVSHNEWFSSSILSIDCSMSYLISSLNSQLALNISK